MSFVHLSVHSEYSLHDSLIRVKPLFAEVSEKKMPAIAITDASNMFATIKAYKQGLSQGVKPIIGSELMISTPRIGQTLMTVLCKNDEGYRDLCEIISRSFGEAPRDANKRPVIPIDWFDGKGHNLVGLSGGRHGEIGRLLMSNRKPAAQESLDQLKHYFGGDFYLELQRIGHPADDRHNRLVVDFAGLTQTPVVATNPVRFLSPDQFATHEVRQAIAQSTSLRSLREDADGANCTRHQYLKSSEEMNELFSDIPSAIENTVRIAAKCSVSLTLDKPFLPHFPTVDGMTEDQMLIKMSREGLEDRLAFYFKTPEAIEANRKEYEDRLEFELKTITDMGFPGYFLIVADFIRWAKANDIAVGPGRGSGAGSLVAYSLGITDINPIPYALLFERFLNPERVSMPDFDVDFCMDKRDKVIAYVADTYGHNAVSQIITYGTMAAKMVIRDVARALGQPYRFADSLAKMIPKRPDVTLRQALAEVPSFKLMYDTDSEVRTVLDHALMLEGLTRQVGKHAGGVVIAPGALSDFTPTYSEPDGSSLVSQYDKDDVESAGLVKFDFLGLRTLTIIDHALETINTRGVLEGKGKLNILDIPLDDSKSFELLQSCETTAVFQLESSGMKNLVQNLQPDCFEDIIALVALFRPGPLQSGMVDDFINRKHGRAEVSYPHPLLKPVLENTYGVIVYQEQVMQIAQILAGYTLGEADMLRRAMGKKKPDEMAQQRAIFMAGAEKNNIDGHLAGQVFDLMEKFAAYGFNKSHSAAYALLAYQTAYLKAHYPADFMAAVLSSQMDDTDKVVNSIHECRSMNLDVLPPDINLSTWAFTPHQGKIIYGMGAIKGLGHGPANEILKDRAEGGHFNSLVDFLYRNPSRKTVIEASINAGMFDYTGELRYELLEQYPTALKASKQLKHSAAQSSLFDFELPPTKTLKAPVADEEIRLNGERKVLGLYLTGHPYTRYSTAMAPCLTTNLSELMRNAEDDTIDDHDKFQSVTLAGLITDVDIRTNSRGNWGSFKLDDNTARVNCRIFNKAYHDSQAFVRDDNLVVIKGRVSVDARTGSVSLIVHQVQLLQSFMEQQPGVLRLTLTGEPSLKAQIKTLSKKIGQEDEGNIRLAYETASGEEGDFPLQGIPYGSPAYQAIAQHYIDAAELTFSSGFARSPVKKAQKEASMEVSADDLEAVKASLRRDLEGFLVDGDQAMNKSVEMSTHSP